VAAVALSALALLVSIQVHDASTMTATQLALDDLRPYGVDLRNQPDETPDPAAAGLLIAVQAPDGAVRRSSMPAALLRAARTVPIAGDVSVFGGEFRVVAETVRTSHGVWRLWAARDLTASAAVLRGIRLSLLVGTPIAVLVTAVAAWLIATAALRPVDRMRTSADRLRLGRATGALPERGAGELADLAATLNGLIDDLRASAEHERRVTADAAHELRTPLAVLAAQVELAERHPDTADLPAIRASVDRMSRLTDHLLALSRADATTPEPAASTPVAELLTEAMSAVDRARLIAPGSVLVDLEVGDHLDEGVSAAVDTSGFARILSNLLGNALAAGPATAVVVRLDLRDEHLVLEVSDDGPGLAEDFLPFAFDRFSRPEGARSSDSAGAGLGLALVERLAQRCGGTASLRNRDPHGATATVTVPVVRGRVE
jgi:signal transduction histidine kinase